MLNSVPVSALTQILTDLSDIKKNVSIVKDICTVTTTNEGDGITSNSLHYDDTKYDKGVHRKFNTLPPALFNLFNSWDVREILGKDTIATAERKLEQVKQGKEFGFPMVIPSFRPPNNLTYKLNTSYPSILCMLVLFHTDVLRTIDGKISVFPLTVYTTTQKTNGYPVLLIHKTHFRHVATRLFSICKKAVKNSTWDTYFSHVECIFDKSKDSQLVTLTGYEPFNHLHQKQENGFFMLPAHWVDAVKYLILQDNHELKKLSEIFSTVYPQFRKQFSDEYKVVWLGVERGVNVQHLIKTGDHAHTGSMTRNRVVDGQIRIGGPHGCIWKLHPYTKKNDMATYNNETIIYGATTWKEITARLNTAWEFFTDNKAVLQYPYHMAGLFHLDTTAGFSLMTRDESIAKGLLNDRTNCDIPGRIRALRYALGKKYGKNFILNFWGEHNVKVCYKQPLNKRKLSDDEESSN